MYILNIIKEYSPSPPPKYTVFIVKLCTLMIGSLEVYTNQLQKRRIGFQNAC